MGFRFLGAALLLLLTGCCCWPCLGPEPTTWHPDRDYNSIPELEYLTITYGNHLEVKKDIFLIDSRAYFDSQGVAMVCMNFRTQKLMELCEARDLIVYTVEGYLQRINEEPGLLPFLGDYPFTADNLRINIEFESYFGKYVDMLYMGRLRLRDGLVTYWAHNALNREKMTWDQRIETYDKAYRFSIFKHMGAVGAPHLEDRLPYLEDERLFREFEPPSLDVY